MTFGKFEKYHLISLNFPNSHRSFEKKKLPHKKWRLDPGVTPHNRPGYEQCFCQCRHASSIHLRGRLAVNQSQWPILELLENQQILRILRSNKSWKIESSAMFFSNRNLNVLANRPCFIYDLEAQQCLIRILTSHSITTSNHLRR